MRHVVTVTGLLLLAACGRASETTTDAVGPGDAATGASGVAFSYGYGFRLPSTRIADAQDRHAQACERLGAGRCRITGMQYDVDDAGIASAALEMKLAGPIARTFAREGVKAIEAAGGTLTGASISGTEAPLAETAAASTEGRADGARVRDDLDRPGLSAAERAELLRQREAATARGREARSAAAEARASVAETPVAFRYEAGRGVGLSARVAGAGQTALASLSATLGFALDALALLGPPLLLLLALVVLWRRLLSGWWLRLVAPTD